MIYCIHTPDVTSHTCFTAEQDRATPESGSAGLRGRRSNHVSSFSFAGFSAVALEAALPSLETKAINSGGLGAEPPMGYIPVMQYT